MAKKTRIEDIDPNLVINSFRQDDVTIPLSARATDMPDGKPQVPAGKEAGQAEVAGVSTPVPTEAVKNEPERRRKVNKPDYEGLFIHEAYVTAREGKQVYISKEYHERIQKIIQVVGKNKLSIASYLNNVLAQHFSYFQDDIEESFEKHIQSYKSVMK